MLGKHTFVVILIKEENYLNTLMYQILKYKIICVVFILYQIKSCKYHKSMCLEFH